MITDEGNAGSFCKRLIVVGNDQGGFSSGGSDDRYSSFVKCNCRQHHQLCFVLIDFEKRF